jgi:hypothetical protein
MNSILFAVFIIPDVHIGPPRADRLLRCKERARRRVEIERIGLHERDIFRRVRLGNPLRDHPASAAATRFAVARQASQAPERAV